MVAPFATTRPSSTGADGARQNGQASPASDVDGLFCATTQARTSALQLCEYLGIDPPYIGSTIVGGSSFEYHVAQAQSAIEAGLCSVAVIAYGSTQRSVGRK